jgi:diaminopimelate decarboxylase
VELPGGEPVDLRILPASSAVSSEGRLSVGGCDLGELAERFGTPLFVYDEDHLRARCREYVAAFPDGRVAYAGKAFLCRAMVRLVDQEGLHLDVATGGELHVALSARFPAERIVFHGNNKSEDELAAALAAGVGRIVADSFDELDRIEALAAAGVGRAPVPVMVRVTPGVEAHTHEYIETGTDDSKFGFSVRAGEALRAARRVQASPQLDLVGLHCHIGSQIFVLDSYARAAVVVARLAAAVADGGEPITEFNLGGGLGVAYGPLDLPPSVGEYAKVLHDALDEACRAAGLGAVPALLVEPGRSIVANAAVTLYRVGTVKDIPGVRTYVSVDGGMSDNSRPAMYGARYEAFVPTRAAVARPRRVTVAGKHCESGDLIVRDAAVPADLAVGDLLCTPATGAYGYAMASNYNKVPRPAVVFVSGGDARLVVRRETLDDLLALEVDQ